MIEEFPTNPGPEDWSRFLAEVTSELDCVTGTLHRLDPEDGLLKLVAYQGIPESLMAIIGTIPVGKGIAGAAAERREAVELCNLQTDTSGVAKPGAKETRVQGALAVPVLDGDRLCGTLGVGKREPYEFLEEEKARLLSLAAAVAARLVPV